MHTGTGTHTRMHGARMAKKRQRGKKNQSFAKPFQSSPNRTTPQSRSLEEIYRRIVVQT